MALALLAGCGKPEPAAALPRPVVAQPAQPQSLASTWTLPGTVQARDSTPLSFRVPGKIVERTVRLGDAVRPGQVLARLDAADTEKNAAAARAQLSAAQHQLDFASQQLERDRLQFQEDLIAANQWEQTQNAHASALALRDQSRQQAALAEDQQRYTTLRAERAGVITAEVADTGQNVAAGQPVYQLAWSGALDVVGDLPESVLGQVAVGQPATLGVPALPGQSWRATLRELAPAADPQSRTFRAKFTVEQPTPSLRMGMTAAISFQAAQPPGQAPAAPGYVVPATALFHEGGDPAVWVVSPGDQTLELRRVTVARYGARSVMLSAGLRPGEVVVWQGVHTVSAGEKVRPVAPLHPEDFSL